MGKGGRNTDVIGIRMLKVEIEMLKGKAGEKSVGEYLREQIRKGLERDKNALVKPVRSGVDTSKLSKGPGG